MGQKQVTPVSEPPLTPISEPPLTEVIVESEAESESSVLVTPRYSAEYMKMINDCLEQLQAFTGRTRDKSVGRLFRMVMKHVKPQAYEPCDDILFKGDACSGIYFLMEGTVSVVTEDGENVIATLMPGHFFGEVSTLYKLPVTARVRAQSRCQCFVLEEDKVWSFLPRSSKTMDIIDWFVARKYIPTSSSLECQRIYRRMLLNSFVQLPLFLGWSEPAIKDLILTLSAESVILYPPNAFISCVGDPGNAVHILLRGRAMISGKSGLQVETTGLKYPIVIGEAGMFMEKPSVLNVKTLTECQVVSIRLDVIQYSLEEESNDCSAAWDRRKKLLEEYAKSTESLDDASQDIFQFEVIFQHLSNSSLFSNSSLPLLDQLTRESRILQIGKGKLAYNEQDSNDRTVMLVLGGHLEMVEKSGPSTSTQEDIQTVTQGQMIAKVPGMPTKVTYKSVGRSYVIKYTTAFLKQTLSKFSTNKTKESR